MGDGTKARGSREYIRKAIEGSLQRLRTDVIDLYQYHTPDGITPFEETFGALDELVREGKVRYVGHSNLKAAQVEEIDAFCREQGFARPVSAQNQYSLMRREAEEELLPTCERLGIGVLPYFPLASGLLTGKYSRGGRSAGRNAPLGSRRGLHGRDLRSPRSARGVCASAWRDAVERCDRRPPRTTGDRVRHRRRDEARAGPRERGSSRMAADAGRPGGAQRPPLARHVPTGAVWGQTPRPVPLAKAPANGTFILAWSHWARGLAAGTNVCRFSDPRQNRTR